MFRTLGKSKIAFVLAILFGISLFFFRGGSRYSNFFNSDNIIASVSGTPISTSKFSRTMQMNISQFNQMLGKSLTGEEIKSFQIHSLALGALVNDAVFENEYDNQKFKLDETVIAQKTKEKIPQLYDSNNQLDDTYLTSFLQQQQLKIEDIVQIINFETRDQFFNDAFFKINYPDYFTRKIDNYNNQKRKIHHLELSINQVDINDIIELNSSNILEILKKFYDENINQYMSLEKRNIEYIFLNKNNYIKNFIPSDFEIEEYYNNNKYLYFDTEKRSFLQFNFKTIEEANNFSTKINKFENYYEIINYSENNNIKFNKFENLKADEVLREISTPLFNLKINEKSDIIETTLAKHIIVLQSIVSEKQIKLKDVKETIKDTISIIEVNNYFVELNNNISNDILNGKSLNEIANNYNLQIKTIIDLTEDYKEFDSSQNELFSSLIPKVFVANKEFVSDIININEDNAYVFNVNNIILSKPLDFDSVKEKITQDWKLEKRVEKLYENFEKNKDKKNYIYEIASEFGLQPKELILDINSQELPGNLVSNIFNSRQGQNLQFINDKEIHFANIVSVEIPNEDFNKTNISMINELKSAFGSELIKNKNISTNENLINAILDQY